MFKTPPRAAEEPAHDILRAQGHPLDVFFSPRNVALIGATETAGSVGRTLMWNLITNPFGGTVFPVNPKRASVLGVKAYRSLADLPDRPDLAVIGTPAPSVPGVIRECVQAGVQGAIVISAGFKELGPEGLALEQELLVEAQRGGLRVIGPNCLGVMNPLTRLNATFARGLALPGGVAFISQSGALCTAVLDWALKEQVGFSGFVSVGSMSDVGWGDLIDYFGRDPNTSSILIYMESVGDARAFMSAARAVALNKPIIVIKVGRTAAAAKAAASHTGSLTGSDDVLDAAFRRSGVLRVQHISELFNMAEVLSRQPQPRGPRLTIVTNAGGPGVLATDELIGNGGQLSRLSPAALTELDGFLPPAWSHDNPIDILGDADPERYARALSVAARDPNTDGMLVILTPQDMTDPTRTARRLREHAHIPDKPVLASWMGGVEVGGGENILNEAGIATFPYPDSAARAFMYMWQRAQNLKLLYETPASRQGLTRNDQSSALALLDAAQSSGRAILTEHESKQLLSAYSIPTVSTRLAASADEARRAADAIGYPVVLKLHSFTITHKTDVGGVQLNLREPDDVARAFDDIQRSVTEKAGAEHFQGVTVQQMVALEGYELILGASPDPQFGPVLLFGLGGQLVEVFRDRALALPPLSTVLARRLMERTKIYQALQGVRGRKPVDQDALEHLLVRFSELVMDQPSIKEIEINPLLASARGLLALDARVVVYTGGELARAAPPVIAPYPVRHEVPWTSPRGLEFMIRPIRPEDEPAVVRFHGRLSESTVYRRYAEALQLSERTAHERFVRICFIDYAREMALVADHRGEVAALIRLDRLAGHRAELSIVVAEPFQSQGLGGELVRRIVGIAPELGLLHLEAVLGADNRVMAHLLEKHGFALQAEVNGEKLRASLSVAGPG